MSTRTRAQQRSTTSSRRFGRPAAVPQGRRATAGRSRNVDIARRKRSSGKGGSGLQALTGRLAGGAGKKASGGAGKGAKAGAGVAMLTAAAGLAFKNRDKLTSMLKRDGGDQGPGASSSALTDTTSPTSTMDAAPPVSAMDAPGGTLAGSPSALDSTPPSSLDPPTTGLGGAGGPLDAPSPLDPPGAPSPLDPSGTASEPPADATGSPSPFEPDGPPPADGTADDRR